MRNVTPSRLRDDIDSGRTGDKVPASDPAAAPLGTDEEAAGTPIPPEAVAAAHRYEVAGPASVGQGTGEPTRTVVKTFGIAAAMIIGVALMIGLVLLWIR
jgi:hypothetical protein